MNKNTNRIFILGDIHFGVRASSMEWFEITKSYFEDFFIPFLKENVKEGDVLVQLGDIFENRQIINIKINSYVLNLMERLGKILPVYTIAGNHDIYFKKTNSVSSLDGLKYIPNINIFKKPEIVKFNNTKCLFMPWRYSPEHEKETLNKFKDADYIFCHSEMNDVMLNMKSRSKSGNKIKRFKNYKRVYSGHIHYAQVHKNIVLVGNAYQMTRSDIDNAKGIYVLDLNTGKHEFFENTISPKFCKINLLKILDMKLGDLKKIINNNFVDLYIPHKLMINSNVTHLINLIQDHAKKIEPFIYDADNYIDIDDIDNEIESGYKNFDINNLCKKWTESLDIDEDYSEKIANKIDSLFIQATSSYNTET